MQLKAVLSNDPVVMVRDKNKELPRPPLVKRILVATNSVESSAFTLGVAANVALMMQARLEALFVEDIALLRLAALPFATELSEIGGARRALNLPDISIALQEQVNFLRRSMQDVVENNDLQTKLRVTRGDFMTEALSAKSDVLFITPPRQILRAELGTVKHSTALRSSGPQNLPVYVYLQSDSATRRAAIMANKLARQLHSDLIFLVRENSRELVSEIKTLLEGIENGVPNIRFELIETGIVQASAKAASQGCALFVSSRTGFTEQDDRRGVAGGMSCPMMFVS